MVSQVPTFNIVVMGVSGCGKSTVGRQLAHRMDAHFVDGDDLHPPQNVAKMSAGVALNDSDRAPWLTAINAYLRDDHDNTGINLVACSALKRQYRVSLSQSIPILFVHLTGNFELIQRRSEARQGHFMNLELLQSQFDTLEEPNADEPVVTIPINDSIAEVVGMAFDAVFAHPTYRSWKAHYLDNPQ